MRLNGFADIYDLRGGREFTRPQVFKQVAEN